MVIGDRCSADQRVDGQIGSWLCTGLLNRASLGARVVEIEAQAHVSGGAVSLIGLDLDRFKLVNDTHGHERGDAVSRDVGYDIRKSLRSFALVYRIGGEEFLVLLGGVSAGLRRGWP